MRERPNGLRACEVFVTLISPSRLRIQTLIMLRNGQTVAESVHLFLAVQQTTVWTNRSLCCAPILVITKLCCVSSVAKGQLQFGVSEAVAPLSSTQVPISFSISCLYLYITCLCYCISFFLFVMSDYLIKSLQQMIIFNKRWNKKSLPMWL